jgi:MFS transporter, DHA1 family, tetracycline resistance protein
VKSTKSPLVVILVVIFVDLIGFGMLFPILPLYARRFHGNEMEIGLLFGVYSFMQFLMAPVLGWLSDKYGRRPILMMSLVTTAIGYAIMAGANSLWLLFLARLIQGTGGASVSTASAYIADITPPENRTRRMGLIGAAFGIGFVLGPALGAGLSLLGENVPFWFTSVVAILNAIAVLVWLPEPEQHVERSGGGSRGGLRKIFEEAGSKQLLWVVAAYFVTIVSFAMLTSVYSEVVQSRFGFNAVQSSMGFVLIGFIGALIQGGGIGKMSKRFGDLPLVLIGMIIMGVSMVLVYSAVSVPIFLLLSVGFAIGNSLYQPTLMAIASKNAASHVQGRVMGVMQSASSLARVFGPIFGGFLLSRDVGGSKLAYGNTPFLFGGLLLVIAFLFAGSLLGTSALTRK